MSNPVIGKLTLVVIFSCHSVEILNVSYLVHPHESQYIGNIPILEIFGFCKVSSDNIRDRFPNYPFSLLSTCIRIFFLDGCAGFV